MSSESNFGVLGVFKYFIFFAENLSVVLDTFVTLADLPTLELVLPISISFYTCHKESPYSDWEWTDSGRNKARFVHCWELEIQKNFHTVMGMEVFSNW